MTIQLEINGETTTLDPGQSIFECAEQVGVRVPNSCRKNGKCRECLVEVIEGEDFLTSLTAEESHLKNGFRLSCRASVATEGSDAVTKTGTVRCHTLRRGEMRIESGATGLEGAPVSQEIDPAVTRDGDWVLLDGERLVEAAGPLLGLAIDVGTTTVVVRLHDLENGEILGVHAFENPQRFAGSDIMARIHFDTEQKGRLLQRTLLGYLGHTVESLPCDPQNIYEVVIAGNTTMRDLFFGLDVYTVGQRPYRSITQNEVETGERQTTTIITTAKKLRLPIFPEARIVGLPLIGGHVGSDAAACLLAIGLANEDRTVALMDIGTNTELVIGNRHKILSASCPAGPAFEGGAIQCGMPGLEGAIESVRLSETGVESLGVIGETTPLGICGSGLIELMSELLRTGRMDELGRFTDDSDQFVIDASELLSLYESDISELAQAKGANVAGLRIILDAYGINLDELDCFYLAGGFARHLDLDASRRIGLIPNLPSDKLFQVGNAAIEGASLALCSSSQRTELETLVRQIDHVELETNEHFFDYFVEGCQFVPINSTRSQQL